ncbi:hypothetical protein ABPG72_001885 [Tetrahymena utriculariae]
MLIFQLQLLLVQIKLDELNELSKVDWVIFRFSDKIYKPLTSELEPKYKKELLLIKTFPTIFTIFKPELERAIEFGILTNIFLEKVRVNHSQKKIQLQQDLHH